MPQGRGAAMSRNISIAVAVATVTLISAVGHAGNKAAADRQQDFLCGSMAVASVLTKQQEALMLAGPTIADLTIFTASDLLLTYGVSADAWYAPIIFMAGMLWPTID